MDNFISILRDAASPEELETYKVQLFRENVRLRTDRTELDEMKEQLEREAKRLDEQQYKLQEERRQLNEETKQLKKELQTERRRLQEDAIFFDKKQKVLEQAFRQLDVERRSLERSKQEFANEQKSIAMNNSGRWSEYYQGAYFRGVTNSLALKKRYKDLLKIFHPDNMSGDSDTLIQINMEYEKLKRNIN